MWASDVSNFDHFSKKDELIFLQTIGLLPQANTLKKNRRYRGDWSIDEFMNNGCLGLLLTTMNLPPFSRGGVRIFFKMGFESLN